MNLAKCMLLIMVTLLSSSPTAAQESNKAPTSSTEPSSSQPLKTSGDGNSKDSTTAKEKGSNLRNLIKACLLHQESTANNIDKALSQLDTASKSADAAQVQDSLAQTQQLLKTMKTANQKSAALLTATNKHVGKIHKKANKNIKQMIDEPDPDFDDVIWAF